MKRQVFFSFCFADDAWRAGQIRNMGLFEQEDLFSDNGWEKVRMQSDDAIKRWIDREMNMRSCLVVLIGERTASRKWVKYEIEEAWRAGKGIVGVYIHKMEDQFGQQAPKGENPFEKFYIDKNINYISERSYPVDENECKLSLVCKAYDSVYLLSKNVYLDIKMNIEDWIEEAIDIRGQFKS